MTASNLIKVRESYAALVVLAANLQRLRDSEFIEISRANRRCKRWLCVDDTKRSYSNVPWVYIVCYSPIGHEQRGSCHAALFLPTGVYVQWYRLYQGEEHGDQPLVRRVNVRVPEWLPPTYFRSGWSRIFTTMSFFAYLRAFLNWIPWTAISEVSSIGR